MCKYTPIYIYIYIGCLTHIYVMSRNNMAVKFSHLKTRKHLCKEIRQINADVNKPSSPSWKKPRRNNVLFSQLSTPNVSLFPCARTNSTRNSSQSAPSYIRYPVHIERGLFIR